MATTKEQREMSRKEKQTERQRDIEWKETLIREIYKYPCIWDKRTKEHRDRQIVEASWKIISKKMKTPEERLRKQWKSLMDHFRNLYVDITKVNKSGDTLYQDKLLAVKWPFFQKLMFLKDVVKSRSTIHNIVISEKDDHEVETIMNFDSIIDQPELSDSTSSLSIDKERNNTRPTEDLIFPPSTRNKRPRNGSFRQIMEYQKTLLGNELRDINRELAHLHSRPSDNVDRFTAHLGDIIREIPQSHRHACFQALTQVVYQYLQECNTS